MNITNKFSNTMAMDEEEQEPYNTEEETAEENKLETRSMSFCSESVESPSVIETSLTPACDRYGGRQDDLCSVEDCEPLVSPALPSHGKESKVEAVKALDRSNYSSCSVSEDSDSDEENNSLLSSESFIGTPLSTGKRNSHSKRSANKCIETYNPQHDFFADCPELNKADGILKWDNLEPKSCASHQTSVPTLPRSANNVDNFITPKRVTVTPKRSNSRSAKKNFKRNLKVTDILEANTGKMTNTESLCMLMRGHRVVRDLLRRAENMRDRKCLKQKHGSPVSGGNVSPMVAGVHPLPHTPSKPTVDREGRNILAAQSTTPILDSYDKDTNCIDEFAPTQPSSMLILQGVIAYVEVRSGGDNRSMGVKDQLQRLGAIVSDTFSEEVTHVVFKDGLPSTYNKALRRGIPVVSVLWIEACKKVGLRVSERMYPVEDKSTRATVKPQKKFRKMKSIQPDYDGKVEKKKMKGRRDVCQGAEEEADKCSGTVVTPKINSSELNSIPESPNMSDCFKFLKQCVLPSGQSTDSDCSPDNLRVRKKKAVKKNVPPVPKWARKSFSGNSVAETLIGVAKIRRKDVQETKSESSPNVVVKTGVHDSPLAMRLLHKISSPSPVANSTEKGSLSHTDVDSVNNISNVSERYETPKRKTDRGAMRKIITKEKRQKVLVCACTSVCVCSGRLKRNICGTNFNSAKHNTKLPETVQEEGAVNERKLRKKAKGSLNCRKVSFSEVGETNTLEKKDASRNHCHSFGEAEEQSTSRSVTINEYGDTGYLESVTPKAAQCANNIPNLLMPVINDCSEKYFNSLRDPQPCGGKIVEGETSILTDHTPLKPQNTSDQLCISKESCPLNDRLTVSVTDDSSLTSNPSNLAQMQTSVVETQGEPNSEYLSSEEKTPKSKDVNVVDTANQISVPVVNATAFETDEDEFSSSESDVINPEVEKCIATVTEDLENAESEWEQLELAEKNVKENSTAAKETAPKRPLKRKLAPTLDMESTEPIVVSGIKEVQFPPIHQRKRRRCSLSDIYGFHINNMSPKSSSEPDMRNIGSSCRDKPRLSDDVSLLWKQKKATRNLRTPPLPSLVCTSLHKEKIA